MPAQQGDHDLAAPQPVLDLLVPRLAGAYLVDILPDLVSAGDQIDTHPVGQFLGILPAVADEDLAPRSRRRTRRDLAVVLHRRLGCCPPLGPRRMDAGLRFGLRMVGHLSRVGRSRVDQPLSLLVLGQIVEDQVLADPFEQLAIAAQQSE
jgi:hypothetical protein